MLLCGEFDEPEVENCFRAGRIRYLLQCKSSDRDIFLNPCENHTGYDHYSPPRRFSSFAKYVCIARSVGRLSEGPK